MKEYNEEYIIEITEKIEKLTGLTDWDHIRIEHKLPYNDGYEIFNDMLDECYPKIELLGHKYDHSGALKKTDPIAYRCAMNEYFDNDISEGNLFAYWYSLKEYIGSEDFSDADRIQIFYREDLEKLLNKLENKKAV